MPFPGCATSSPTALTPAACLKRRWQTRGLACRDRATLRRRQGLGVAAMALSGWTHDCVAQPQSSTGIDFEATVESAVTWIYIASVQLLARRLAAA